MGKKRIKLKIGDLLIKHDNGIPEVGILHKKNPPYFCEVRESKVPTTWKILGWIPETKYLESFLKRQIEQELIEHCPAKK